MWAKPTLARAIRGAKMRFGARVRDLRRAEGLTQEEVAERAGVHPKYVSRVEGGLANPSLAVVIAIANALSLDPAHLFAQDAPTRR
ncbi:MAG: helix-turn-helix transcriptional regulator [Sandaracinaceae bacterium]|nr:helix-turn-helix transcriptional regulator [Sandaracinaceae bacterium]